MKIRNRTFIVSGGCSGLGLATVEMLLEQGAFTSVFDVAEPSSEWKQPNKVQFYKVDITNAEEIEAAVNGTADWASQTGATLGGVINCAGIAVGSKIVAPPHSLDLWNLVMNVNVTGTFNLSRLVGQRLISVSPDGDDGERGVIIMVSSSAAFEGQIGQTAYAATKGAIRSMTLPMARDLGQYGVRVNTIAPSIFESPMTSQMRPKVRESLTRELIFPKRWGQSYEFASTVKWILETPFVNGDTFRLSGASRMPAKL